MSNLDLLSPVWTHLTNIQPERGEGVYLYDAEGQRYIDFTCGIGVTNTGHCHPKVVKAIQEQAEKLIFGQMNIVVSPSVLEVAETLNKVTLDSINSFFFSNSGAEAVEGAVKLAKHATKRSNVIVFQGSFHGRTAQTMAMTTSKTIYRHHYQPLPSGVFVAPFPYSYYYGWDDSMTIDFCLSQLQLMLKGQTPASETAAMVIEPVLGEGGYVPAPPEFLRELRAICDEIGILLIADEIQTGFGRTGRFFAYEYADIEPDILIMAKGLGSGLPISAIGANRSLMEKWTTGAHGGTYGGGSAISAIGAKATIEVIQEESLVNNSYEMGKYLKSKLSSLQEQFPCIGDVRGLGLMIGVVFTKPDGSPDKQTTSNVLNACLDSNLLLLTCGTFGNVIRWIPPLIVTQEQIDEAMAIFEIALRQSVPESVSM